MSKPFITYTAQVEKLKNEKDLVITDDDFAVESLQNISYYALIGGYKHPLLIFIPANILMKHVLKI